MNREEEHHDDKFADNDDNESGSMIPQGFEIEAIVRVYKDVLDYNSLCIVGGIAFVGESSRGILFPVLWALCQYLNGSLVDQGYLVAMFSLGRLIVTAPLGYICDVYGHKLPLLIASSILLGGSILWANSYLTASLVSLYSAQFLMGCGSGSLGVTRAFVVEQVEPKSRTEMLAFLTALQYAGFTVLPVLGAAIWNLGDMIADGDYWAFGLPAYFVVLLALACLVALVTRFKGISREPRKIEKEEAPLLQSVSAATYVPKSNHIGGVSISGSEYGIGAEAVAGSILSTVSLQKLIPPPPDPLNEQDEVQEASAAVFAQIVMLLLNIATKGSISVYETLGAQIAANDYGMTSSSLSYVITVAGAVGFVQLLVFKTFWCKYFSDMQLILGGMAAMIISQVLMVSWSLIPPSMARFLTSVVLMYSIGYPIGQTAVLGAFSKIQKSGPQGALLGWFATAGSLARIAFPVMAGYVDKYIDDGAFGVVLALLCGSYLALVLLQPQLSTMIDCHSHGSRIPTKAPAEAPQSLESSPRSPNSLPNYPNSPSGAKSPPSSQPHQVSPTSSPSSSISSRTESNFLSELIQRLRSLSLPELIQVGLCLVGLLVAVIGMVLMRRDQATPS